MAQRRSTNNRQRRRRRRSRQNRNITTVSSAALVRELTYRRNDLARIAGEQLGEYKPYDLPSETVDRMLKNGVVKSSLMLIKAPIISTFQKAQFVSDDEKVQTFLNQELHPVLMQHMDSILTAFEWGVSFHEKIFEVVNDLQINIKTGEEEDDRVETMPSALLLKKLKFNQYNDIKSILLEESTQDFRGYRQTPRALSSKPIDVPAWKSFVFAFDNSKTLWGETSLVPAYAPWYSYELLSAYLVRYAERSATPPLIGKAPPGTSEVNVGGTIEQVDNLVYLSSIGAEAANSNIVVFPSTLDITHGESLWGIQEMRLDDRSTLYKDSLSWLKSSIHEAVFAPQQSISNSESDTGNYGLAENQFEAFLVSEAQRVLKLKNAINKYIVDQIVEYNFGADVTAELIVHDITKEITTRTFQVVTQLIKAKHPQSANIDFIALCRGLGIETRDISEEEMKAFMGMQEQENNEGGEEGEEDDEDNDDDSDDSNSSGSSNSEGESNDE